MADGRFPNTHRADPAVVQLLQEALEAATNGAIRAITIVTVNQVHEVEHRSAGATGTATHALIGGLSAEAHYLLQNH